MMNFQTNLEPFSMLGMAGIQNSGPFYINDASIVIPVGNHILQQSFDTGERKFLLSNRIYQEGPCRYTKLTGFCVDMDGDFVAIASNRYNEPPVLLIYHNPTWQIHMSISNENSSEIYYVSFHRQPTSRLGLFLSTEPRNYQLNLFDLNIKQVTKKIKLTERFETATYHPHNGNIVILYSQKCLGYINLSCDEEVTILNVPNYSKFTSFLYSNNEENVTVATSGRDLIFLLDFQLHHIMTITESSSIVYAASFSHGFIICTENNKIVLIQHVPGHKEFSRIFQQGASISYGCNYPIRFASISPSGHQLVLNVDYRRVLILNIRELESNSENCISNPNIVSHKGPIASISSCAYKPMIASCGSEDRTVIVWDYSKQQSILQSEFTETLIQVSFHPSGDLLAVASTEKLYLLSTTVDSLVQQAQWPLFNCLSVQFSNGGHFLVAASHIITFINPYTQEIIATLRGHTGLIHSLSWSPDDKRLVSCGSDGCVVEWNAVTQERAWSVTVPKRDFDSSVITDRGTVIACSKSEMIHHFYNGRFQQRISENSVGFSTSFFATPSCIILGDIYGGICVVPFPFIVPSQYQAQFENIPQLEFSESNEIARMTSNQPIPFVVGDIFKIHCGNVTSICSSLDNHILFSSSTDSSISIFNILSPSQTYMQSEHPILRCDIPKQQFFHVSQSRFDEIQHAIEKLKRDIQKQRGQYEIDTIRLLQQHQKLKNEVITENEEKKEKLMTTINKLKDSIDDSTVKAALIYQNMESAHLSEAKSLTNLYEQKLSLERDKCYAIEKELENLKCSYEERIYLLRQQYKSSLQDFSDKVDFEQDQLTHNLESTKNKITETQDQQDKDLIELEMEFENERRRIDLEFHNKMNILNKQLNDIEAKRALLRKDIDKQKLDLDSLEAELKNAKEKKAELDKDITGLQHTQECRTSELNDRDETLIRQAERLEKLQESNVELQKNKDIMNFRVEEMGRELQPTLDEISRLTGELAGNSEEIRTIKRFTKASHRTMQDKLHQIEVLKHKLDIQKQTLSKKQRVIQMFTIDLTEGVQRDDIINRANIIKTLHDKYVAQHDLEDNLKDTNETLNEQTRHRKHLQQSVMLLQRQIHQQQDITSKQYNSKSAQNAYLLGDLNRLQRENRLLKKRLDKARTDMENLELNLKKFKQSTQEQLGKNEKRYAQTSLGPRPQKKAMSDWIQKKTRTGMVSQVSVFDTRGKILHSGFKS